MKHLIFKGYTGTGSDLYSSTWQVRSFQKACHNIRNTYDKVFIAPIPAQKGHGTPTMIYKITSSVKNKFFQSEHKQLNCVDTKSDNSEIYDLTGLKNLDDESEGLGL